jgi:ribonucleoside-diphosphate reductase alpha chain
MQEMIDGDPDKRRIWAKVIASRSEVGIPYVLFRDNANKGRPQVYKDEELEVVASNLCSEIMLPSDGLNSFVCCLSSMNLAKYHEFKETDAVETLTYFLDAVMSEFIEKGKRIPHMDRAVRFAENHRALGLGALGWHTLLQESMIPFEGLEAQYLNNEVFKFISEHAKMASETMAVEYGEAPLMKGYGRRNTTLMAIAPTTSSSTILGQVSQSILPLKSNFFVKDLAKLKYTFRNPTLKRLLKEKGQDTDEVWRSILEQNGSVQHLPFLTDREKNVFRTFAEISQTDIIQQAAQRQNYIDQGQSLNLMIHPDTPAKDINTLMITAWQLGIKSLYYSHSMNAAQEFYRSLTHCTSCEG